MEDYFQQAGSFLLSVEYYFQQAGSFLIFEEDYFQQTVSFLQGEVEIFQEICSPLLTVEELDEDPLLTVEELFQQAGSSLLSVLGLGGIEEPAGNRLSVRVVVKTGQVEVGAIYYNFFKIQLKPKQLKDPFRVLGKFCSGLYANIPCVRLSI